MMRDEQTEKCEITGKPVIYRNNRFYFTRQMERRVLFGLTLLMLVWGALVRLGVLP